MSEETAVLILGALIDIFWAISCVGVMNFFGLLIIAAGIHDKN